MPIVSYSQNQEDVLLSIALSDVANGFYVDVGASHPEIDSVTKYFYDLGWHGINVEPEIEAFELFLESRDRDHNFNIAIGSVNAEVEFYKSSTSGRHSLIKENAEYLGETVSMTVVEQRTLTDLLDGVSPPISEIHFLKIDVEGLENEVLKGFNFNKYRPWIILVEALNPITLKDESSAWENIILKSGYLMVHFDGLNRYYLEMSQSHRMNCFQRVKIILADFTPFRLLNAQIREVELESEVSTSQQRIVELESEVSTSQQRVVELESIRESYDLIVTGRLYRSTSTLRRFYSFARYMLSKEIDLRLKLKRLSQYLKRYPRARSALMNVYFALGLHKGSSVQKTRMNIDERQFLSHRISLANRDSMIKSFRTK